MDEKSPTFDVPFDVPCPGIDDGQVLRNADCPHTCELDYSHKPSLVIWERAGLHSLAGSGSYSCHTIDGLTQQVGVPVVAGVLLDHMA